MGVEGVAVFIVGWLFSRVVMLLAMRGVRGREIGEVVVVIGVKVEEWEVVVMGRLVFFVSTVVVFLSFFEMRWFRINRSSFFLGKEIFDWVMIFVFCSRVRDILVLMRSGFFDICLMSLAVYL